MVLHDKIPAIYHSFFPELLNIEFPEEKIATCNTCNLCRSSQSPYINTKCCAYQPHLANFLVGAILTDDDRSLDIGKERILGRINARAGVTPYGIIPSVPYSIRQKEVESREYWSRPHELMELQRCSYYDNGNCTVWKYRENLCVTHFCSSIGGVAGSTFWKKINQYLKMAETSLSQYAMVQLGWPPAQIKTKAVTTTDLNIENEEGIVKDEVYKKLWGDWIGKEEAFYRNCYTIIKETDATTFKRITGLNREILEAAIFDTQKIFLQNILPERLQLNSNVVIEAGAHEGYSRWVLGEVYAEIPVVFSPLIRAFNGERQTAAVFQLGYNLLFNMSEMVDDLYKKGILLKVE